MNHHPQGAPAPETTPDARLRLPRLIYIGVWVAVGLLMLLSEVDVLPTGYVRADAQTTYALHVLCIVLTLGCTWGALRLLATPAVRRNIKSRPERLPHWNLLRTGLLAFAIVVNVIVYYALLGSTTPLFCLLIALTGFVFCWPKQGEQG